MPDAAATGRDAALPTPADATPAAATPAAATHAAAITSAAPGAPWAAEAELRASLLDSRQRWRDVALLAADFAFETDAAGRLAFLAPDPLLDWPVQALLGQPARRLLLRDDPDPFALRAAARGVDTWLRDALGQPRCFRLSVVPLSDSAGGFAGLRGAGREVTAEVSEAETQATALRRAGAIETLVRRVRRQVLAPRMLATTLEAMPAALGCSGAALVELSPAGVPTPVHRHGADPGPLLAGLGPLLAGEEPCFLPGPAGEPLAVLPQPHRRAPRQALLAWRRPGGRPFDADDRHLLVAAADLLFVLLGNQALQRELERQARTDPLTGLLNRRAFLDDLHRRLERLAMTPAPVSGALFFLDLDNFKPLNDRMGHEAGDAALVAVANLLRDLVRPADLVARFGGDEFALWIDPADAAVAAQRAEAFCRAAVAALPAVLPGLALPLTFSIGGALYQGDAADGPEALVARADVAMYAAKRAGRNGWRLAAGGGA